MIDKNKINQVYAAIIENGLEAFKDIDLAKLLSILNRCELEKFNKDAYKVFYNEYKNESIATNNSRRINRIIPLVNILINDSMDKIRTSNLIQQLNESLRKDTYNDLFKKCSIDELTNIKYYLSNNVNSKDSFNIKATNKLINIIRRELKTRIGRLN